MIRQRGLPVLNKNCQRRYHRLTLLLPRWPVVTAARRPPGGAALHSGIALWGRVAKELGDPYTYAGHLVMFPSNYGFYDLYGRAGIHKNADKAKKVGKQHDWNRIEILAQGDRIRFVLNG